MILATKINISFSVDFEKARNKWLPANNSANTVNKEIIRVKTLFKEILIFY